jgi:GNAT superfamily N-acetyltransferase
MSTLFFLNMEDDLAIRTMTRDDVRVAIEWAAQEGWNPGVHDAECFHSADPEGFFIGELGGEPVATISVVNYDDRFAFAGLYIVRQEYRGKGYGPRLFDHAWNHAGDRIVGGDCVFAMQDKYRERDGLQPAYRNIRFEGAGGGESPNNLVKARDLPFDRLLEYDRTGFPAARPAFLQCWLRQGGSSALAYLHPNERIGGYGVIRQCMNGHKIGPLFADTPEIAELIYRGLSATAPDELIYLDTPEPNEAAVALAKRHGMIEVFGTERMYTREIPELPIHRIFGVTSFELG